MEAKEEYGLNDKQALFCKLYTSKEFYGNGVQSYCEAYGKDYNDYTQKNSATHSASILLQNVNISKYINDLLDAEGLNDNFVDKRLLFLMSQNEDKGTSLGAIREYNKLKQRITDKLDVKVSGGFDISLKLE